MIQQCEPAESEEIYEVINDAASAYSGVVAADCWNEPYMSRDELRVDILLSNAAASVGPDQ